MSNILNMVSVITATTGTGPITLGAAASAQFVTEVQSGAVDQRPYGFHVQENADFMMIKGTYTAATRQLSIDTVLFSMIAGVFSTTAQMTLAGSAVVTFVSEAEDFQEFRGIRDTAGTSDTIVNDDGGGLVTYSNAAAIAVAIAQAGALKKFKKGWYVWLRNNGAGPFTITPTTSTINSATTLAIPTKHGALVYSDGANYKAFILPLSPALIAVNNLADVANPVTALANIGGAVNNAVLAATTDLNTVLTSGCYVTVDSSSTNAPFADFIFLEVQNYGGSGASDCLQIARSLTLTPAQSWFRTKVGGAFAAWQRVLVAGNNLSDLANPFTALTSILGGVSFGGIQSLSAAQQNIAQKNAGLAAVMRGHLAGLTLSTAGSSSTFGVAVGVGVDSTNADFISLTAAFTKTTAAWAIGSAAGGLDTGTIAASTWYHAHLIKRVDTGVVDVLVSLSATTPTMPTSYTLFRRIGSMKTNGSSQWVLFHQRGDEFLLDVSALDVNAASIGIAVLTPTLSVPTGVQVGALFSLDVSATSTGILAFSPDQSLTAASNVFGSIRAQANANMYMMHPAVRTNTSAQIKVVAEAAGSLYTINTLGWIDTRGKLN